MERNEWIYKVLLFLLLQIVDCNTVPKLILISMDGFRYDYLDLIPANETENFQYFIKNGVKAKWIKNVFPTVTYPNHYTLLTGLYPESHGIVHNRFYDIKWKEHFLYDNRMANFDPMWFDVGAEPIYVTNNKAGSDRKSGSVLFPGGLASVKCIAPDRIIEDADPFSNTSLTERVDKLISWFTAEKDPVNLGLLYIPEPDEIAHTNGAASDKVISYIKTELNDILGYLFKKLKDNDLFDSMNIILTSDHGFSNITKFVNLDLYLNNSWYKTGSDFQNHITVHLWPEEGYKSDDIIQRLENITDIYIYKKGEQGLKDLHYNNNRRIAPIVLTGHEGVAIVNNDTDQATFAKGMHGYDPNKVHNMRPFFLAMGPAFKKGYLSDPFDNINIYPLMCHILGVTPAPNNGSLDNVKQLLMNGDPTQATTFTPTAVSFVLIVGIGVTVAGLFAICACHNARKQQRFLLPLSDRNSGTNRLLHSDDEDEEF